ncbi:MAG: tetratricopeptide repeat protein [Anaerolineae bacterium]|nr:tetratricopeptide repeat protein [Anaerolineae bacterium]
MKNIMLSSNKLKQVWLMASLIILVACSPATPDNNNVTYVVVTNTPPVVSVASAQPIQPTFTPTPDMPPEIGLQVANRYWLDGYFENAVFAYQALLERGNTIPAEIRAEAAYGMGRAALREGLFNYAIDPLTILISEYPNDFRGAQAYFMRGDAYMGLSMWQEAINDYQLYLQIRPNLIDSYVYERVGDAQLNLGQTDAAYASYIRSAETARYATSQAVLHERVARLHLARGEVDLAVAEYDKILEFAQNTAYRAQIAYAAAEALINSGDMARGTIRMRQVFDQYPESAQAYSAMQLLMQNGQTLDNYRRGLVNYFNEQYESAVTAFNTYTTEAQLADIPADLHLYLGISYRALGNFEAANVAFRTITTQYPNDPLFGNGLLEQGRTKFVAQDIDGAITEYLSIAQNFGYLTDTAAEALWRAGYLYATTERPSEARDIFLRLADAYPNTTQAISGLQSAANALLTINDTFGAETIFARIATIPTASADDRADAYLQVGRLAFARGDQNTAQTAFNQAASISPNSYYAARARDILAGRAPFTPPTQYQFEFDIVADVTEAEDWLRATFGITQPSPLWVLSPELEQDPRIVRGRELWALGIVNEAQDEFDEVISAYSDNALASYQLAVYMNILGAYRPSIFAAANVLITAGVATLDAPEYIARLRFPAYYRDVVINTAQRYNFDPLLMFSLIRHESFFETYATAAAGEKGLTQVIPPTGEYIAQQLNWRDYQHSDLFRPYAGIEFGAFYLAEQLVLFDYNVYAALGAYNAGPGRSIAWLEIAGDDPDRFMSAITISSTQLYIQRIYNNYAMYRELYGEG